MLLMLLLVGTGMLGDPAKANVLIMQGSPGETEARQQEQALANAAREARFNMPQSNVAILPRVKRLRGRGPTPIKVAQGRITTLLFTKSGRAIDPGVVMVCYPVALHVEASALVPGAASLLSKKMLMSADLVVYLDRGDPEYIHSATDLKHIHGLVELADKTRPTSLMP